MPALTRTQPSDDLCIQPHRSVLKQLTTGPFIRHFALVGYAIVALLAGALSLECLLWAAWSVSRLLPQGGQSIQASSPVYSKYPWASEFLKEDLLRQKLRMNYVPFRIWGNVPFSGKYINNDAGKMGVLRRTVSPANNACAQPPLELWIFGGSTVYGLGVPDWATLPSYLSQDLNSALRKCVVINNFGVNGYVGNQELILLIERLKAGPPPDIVVFYDGVNDTNAALNPGDPAHMHFSLGTIKARIEGSLAGRLDLLEETYSMRFARMIFGFVHARRSPTTADNLPTTPEAVVDNYEANLKVAKALSKVYNFKLYEFWQPSIYYGHKPLVPFEQHLASIHDAWSIAGAAVYEVAEHRASKDGGFVFLGALFDQVREPIYIDQVHTGPRGNELAAEAIARYILGHSE